MEFAEPLPVDANGRVAFLWNNEQVCEASTESQKNISAFGEAVAVSWRDGTSRLNSLSHKGL